MLPPSKQPKRKPQGQEIRLEPEPSGPGRYVRDVEFAKIHSIPRQTLANWRYRDRKAGRSGAALGYPFYKRFGPCVRYWLASSDRTREGAA
jgi:hypothetical protein